jgi:hypothetical protein
MIVPDTIRECACQTALTECGEFFKKAMHGNLGQ